MIKSTSTIEEKVPIFIVASNWNAKGNDFSCSQHKLEKLLNSGEEDPSFLKKITVSFVYIIGRKFECVFANIKSLKPIRRGEKEIHLVRDLIFTKADPEGNHTIPCEYNYLRIPFVYGIFLEELKVNFNITSTSVFHLYVGLDDDAYRIFFEHSGSGYFGHREDICVYDEDKEIELLWDIHRIKTE